MNRAIAAKRWERGSYLGKETCSRIPASAEMRPLRDRLIVEPLDVVHSRILIVPQDGPPLRGIVRAVGPGRFRLAYDAPKRYDTDPYDPARRKRSKMWETRAFVPMDVKVGDVVRLEGFHFDAFYWGDTYCICCTQQDVCWIEDATAEPVALSA